jgi:hypothetical protein
MEKKLTLLTEVTLFGQKKIITTFFIEKRHFLHKIGEIRQE